ncbi:MAG: hypothetical protein AAF829_06595 [Pseudomonadota bacterium]
MVAVAIAALCGISHNHSFYSQHWQLLLDAANPWEREHQGQSIDFNAYGPGNLILAPLLSIHDLAPKISLTLAMFLVALILSQQTEAQGTRGRDGILSAAVLFVLCPLTAFYV